MTTDILAAAMGREDVYLSLPKRSANRGIPGLVYGVSLK